MTPERERLIRLRIIVGVLLHWAGHGGAETVRRDRTLREVVDRLREWQGAQEHEGP